MQPHAHRFLAARVIDQAVRDVRNANGALIDNASAREFLSGSPMLSYWCEIANLDLSCVVDRARALMADCDARRASVLLSKRGLDLSTGWPKSCRSQAPDSPVTSIIAI